MGDPWARPPDAERLPNRSSLWRLPWKHQDSNHRTDVKIVALLAVMLACLVGLIALLIHDPSIDASRLQPFSAHASALPRAAPAKMAPIAPVAEAKVTPEDNWAADESSHGLRPDAAH